MSAYTEPHFRNLPPQTASEGQNGMPEDGTA